jgi:hypothetical protein
MTRLVRLDARQQQPTTLAAAITAFVAEHDLSSSSRRVYAGALHVLQDYLGANTALMILDDTRKAEQLGDGRGAAAAAAARWPQHWPSVHSRSPTDACGAERRPVSDQRSRPLVIPSRRRALQRDDRWVDAPPASTLRADACATPQLASRSSRYLAVPVSCRLTTISHGTSAPSAGAAPRLT